MMHYGYEDISYYFQFESNSYIITEPNNTFEDAFEVNIYQAYHKLNNFGPTDNVDILKLNVFEASTVNFNISRETYENYINKDVTIYADIYDSENNFKASGYFPIDAFEYVEDHRAYI